MTFRGRGADAARAVLRFLRLVPGYRWLTGRVVPRVRRSRLVNDSVAVVLGPGAVRPFRLAPGRHLRGHDHSLVPVVVVNAVAVSRSRLGTVLEEVALLQARTQGFRPVVVLAGPDLAATRTHGWATEVVIAEERWDEADGPWTAYVGHRLATCLTFYRAWGLVTATNEGIVPLDRAVLEALGTHRPARAHEEPDQG